MERVEEPRPIARPLSAAEAAAEPRSDVRAGRLAGDVAEAVLAAAGPPDELPSSYAHGGLTPRELEVLVLLARGASNCEIAKTLVIAEKTPANHVEHIYAKIDVSTRAAAALYVTRQGLLGPLRPRAR